MFARILTHRDRIDRRRVIVEHRQTLGAPRPRAGILLEPLPLTASAATTNRLERLQTGGLASVSRTPQRLGGGHRAIVDGSKWDGPNRSRSVVGLRDADPRMVQARVQAHAFPSTETRREGLALERSLTDEAATARSMTTRLTVPAGTHGCRGGEVLITRRCGTEALARYCAEAMRHDTVHSRWRDGVPDTDGRSSG